MFLSKTEGMLGQLPGQFRPAPAIKRRRVRPKSRTRPEDENFFGTSMYSSDLNDQSRKREVARLFARMRSELVEIAQEFAEEAPAEHTPNHPVRQGIFIEMMIAAEFVSYELDSTIASLCLKGMEAERAGDLESLNLVCKTAALYSVLRNRITEFQRELDSMVELTSQTFQRYEIVFSLNFNPIADEDSGSKSFVNLYLHSIDEAIDHLSNIAVAALNKRDFETVTEFCSCNLQLVNFLSDARALIEEVGKAAII